MEKLWAAVSHQGTVLSELLRERTAPPDPQVPLEQHGALSTDWHHDDMLSIATSNEAGGPEFPSEEVDCDSPLPVHVSLSAELLSLIKRATAKLQVPCSADGTRKQSIFANEPVTSTVSPQCTRIFFLKSNHHGITLLQLWLFPDAAIASLVQAPKLALLTKDATCPNKQFRAYSGDVFTALLGNCNSILVAYQTCLLKAVSESHRPSPQQLEELCLVNKNLLRISKLNGQAVGRNLTALIAARRHLCLSQARVSDGDKALLLGAPITPGHTFGPAVDEMLQRSHRAGVHKGTGASASQAATPGAQTSNKLVPKAPAASEAGTTGCYYSQMGFS
ncbi:UNVERIFIED_CONTAM: hypothetical protein FKN15_049991 [Acipenser sinensis]